LSRREKARENGDSEAQNYTTESNGGGGGGSSSSSSSSLTSSPLRVERSKSDRLCLSRGGCGVTACTTHDLDIRRRLVASRRREPSVILAVGDRTAGGAIRVREKSQRTAISA